MTESKSLPFFWDSNQAVAEPYLPEDEETKKYIEAVLTDLNDCVGVRQNPEPLLNGETIENVWGEAIEDYNVFIPDRQRDDFVKPYVSAIARDKTNSFIANLYGTLSRSNIIAQNREQEIDRVMSRILKVLLDHAFKTDGMPTTNGRVKRLDWLTVAGIEGMAHVSEEYDGDRCVRNLIPNEQIYIPNPWQTDIQAQPYILRVINDITFMEAQLAFGKFDNFKYVSSSGYAEGYDNGEWSFWKDYRNLLKVAEGHVQIIHAWYTVPKDRLPKGHKRAKYYNLLINGVPMFAWDNLMKFKHGYYPISNFCVDRFHPQFYWGAPIPWKIRHEKQYLDALKTMMRFKQKASAFPATITSNPELANERIFQPALVTLTTAENLKEALSVVPGSNSGVSNGDIEMLKLSEQEVDKGTSSPILAGQQPSGNPTAREVATITAYAQKNQITASERYAICEASLDWMRLANIIQFYPRRKLDGLAKVSADDVQLLNGRKGTLEVMFENIPPMSEEEELKMSLKIRDRQDKAAKNGHSLETYFIDPKYLENLDWYVIPEDKSQTDMELAREVEFATQAKGYQGIADLENVWRDLVSAFGKDVDKYVMKKQLSEPGEMPPNGLKNSKKPLTSLPGVIPSTSSAQMEKSLV